VAKKPKARRSLDEILASASDVLFPAELGDAIVTIDSVDCDGDTPLHVMVWRNDVHAVRTLLEAGASANAIGDMGETPLHVAISQGNTAVIEALLRFGARTDIRSEFGETALETAIRLGGEPAKLLRRFVGA
jgi:uncharacterized protein